MRIKNFIIAGLAGLLLTACTEDVAEQRMSMTSSCALKIEVSDNPAATRADYSGFPSTTFETGDAIGLYAFDGSSYVASNIRFVKQSNGSWLPDEEIPYVDDYTYYAYFPYRSTTYTPSTSGTVDDIDIKFDSFITDASNYFWQADQSTKAGYTYSNLMIAKGVVTDADDDAVTIKFTMAHKRGLAVFTVDAAEATFTGNIPYLIGDTKQFLMKPSTATSFTDDIGTYSLTASAGEYTVHNVSLPNDIDLGLPSGLKWAKGNIISDGNGGYKIGAETDYGAYFSWGNIAPHFSTDGFTFDGAYDWGTSNTDSPYAGSAGASISYTSQHKGRDYTANTTNDAARACLGGSWQVPTATQFQELYDNTDSEWTTISGVNGRKFMKKTDHSVYVFFPAAGLGDIISLDLRGSHGYYWSSSLYSADYGYHLCFSSSNVSTQSNNDRYYGFSVRAVR